MSQDTRYITLVLAVPDGDRAMTTELHAAFRDGTLVCGLKTVALGWGDAFKDAEAAQMDLDELREKHS